MHQWFDDYFLTGRELGKVSLTTRFTKNKIGTYHNLYYCT